MGAAVQLGIGQCPEGYFAEPDPVSSVADITIKKSGARGNGER
jgi:hypothetical protein